MMGVVAVVLTRYKLTVFLAVAFLVFVAFRVRILEGSASGDLISPLFIGTGLLLMFLGRDFPDTTWSFTFWIGTHTPGSLCFALHSLTRESLLTHNVVRLRIW